MAIPPVGVFLPSLGKPEAPVADVTAAAAHADSLGFESVRVVDQLIAGTGNALLDSTLVLAASAVATERVMLGLGVLIAPLREPAWIAKQIATLQHLSGDRVILGVGVGGDRHERSWAAAHVARSERVKRIDAALRVLPDVIAGRRPTTCNSLRERRCLPSSPVDVRRRRGARRCARRWFLFPVPPEGVRDAVARVSVPVTANLTVALARDPSVPSREEVLDLMADPDGLYGMPREVAEEYLVYGEGDDVASHLHRYGDAGAARIVVTFAAGDWHRQAELLAHAAGLQ